MDEHALSEAGSDDAAVGTALLMADLEAAIASAGEEIAVLRGVADGLTRIRPVPAESAEPQPIGAEPALTDAGSERAVVSLPEREARVANTPVAAPVSARALVGSVALPETEAAPERVSSLPASVAASTVTLEPVSPQTDPGISSREPDPASHVDMRTNYVSFERTATVAPTMTGKGFAAAAPAIADPPRTAAANWAWPEPVGAASPQAAEPASTEAAAAMASFEPAASRAAAPVGTALVERAASVSAVDGTDPALTRADQNRGGAADGSNAGPTEGDVFLDGERVGRWMARHLARELGGPAASGTAFDPRIGPAWPGALHGN